MVTGSSTDVLIYKHQTFSPPLDRGFTHCPKHSGGGDKLQFILKYCNIISKALRVVVIGKKPDLKPPDWEVIGDTAQENLHHGGKEDIGHGEQRRVNMSESFVHCG
ncbi:hypothetical protein NDU88_003892 [Pleurodeles waltl]|uniref:Uncharacterized protein n=1 Tax=Pleurodeles waltl TaxID=8319 RepID=A0AAV7TR06_PLEWA|nr:hypothetical protein NDU88_003892 [Pleurodeles waltl]